VISVLVAVADSVPEQRVSISAGREPRCLHVLAKVAVDVRQLFMVSK
jgi:hypothetical protein